jgi:hypothetical protein
MARRTTSKIIDRKRWITFWKWVLAAGLLLTIFIYIWQLSGNQTTVRIIIFSSLIVATMQLLIAIYNSLFKKG